MEEANFSAESASGYHAGKHLYEGVPREDVLARMRKIAPGYPMERYEQELDTAMEWAESHRADGLRRRQELIAACKAEDVLNAVFALVYRNRRFGGQYVREGLGLIDVGQELGSSFGPKTIEDAERRSTALINHGERLGFGPWNNEKDMTELRKAHPGFSDEHLGDALEWGHVLGR